MIGLIFGAVPGLGGAAALALPMPPGPMDSNPSRRSGLAVGRGHGRRADGRWLHHRHSPEHAWARRPSPPPPSTAIHWRNRGKAGLAIGAAASANAIGGIIGIDLGSSSFCRSRRCDRAPVRSRRNSSCSPFSGLLVVSTTSRGKFLRGLVSGAFGLMLAFVGYGNDVTGGERFTYVGCNIPGTACIWCRR